MNSVSKFLSDTIVVFFLTILCVLCLFTFCPALNAQSTDATLSGTVFDPFDRVVPEADVVLTNIDTNLPYATKTNASGIYVLPNLPPGRYRLTVTKPGFKQIALNNVELHVQDTLSQNFSLVLGAASETVTVNGGVSMINTTDASVGTVVDRQFVENIPLNGRSFQSLITLVPGVVTAPNGNNSTGQFSVNGQRVSSTSFMVDGVSSNFGNNPLGFGTASTSGNSASYTTLGTTQSLVSVDAMQEFKIQTSSYAPEFGRQPGGQVSIVTRSGTNQFHGSLFEYFRNDVLDANDWFADSTGQQKAAERQNDFGGTFGGPITIPKLYDGSNRTFFFFSYEGLRLRQPQFTLTSVPTLCLRGMGSCQTGEKPAPVALQPILNAFSLPNGKDLGNGLADLSIGYSNPSTLNATSLRIDHHLNDRWTLFARYNRAPSETLSRLSDDPSQFNDSILKTQTGTVGVTAALTPSVSSEFRANYSHNGSYSIEGADGFGGAVQPPRSALIPSQYDSASAAASFSLQIPGAAASNILVRLANGNTSINQLNIIESVSYHLGKHEFKFGVDYRRLTPIGFFSSYSISSTFNSEQQMLTGTPATVTVGQNIPIKPIFDEFSAYGQDTWKVLNRLTLTLGMRWELNPSISEANGHNPLAVNEVSNLAAMQLAPPGTRRWKTTYNNFAPRFGLAYQLSQSPGRETVLRAGYGIFYDTGNDLGALGSNGYPYTSTKVLSNVAYPLSAANAMPLPLPSQAALKTPYPLLVLFDPNLKLPYTEEWNVSVEQSIGKNQALTVSYVGAAGKKLLQEETTTLSKFNPAFTTIQLTRNFDVSNYDALQVQFQRHLLHGLQALASYTWSHALDEDSSSGSIRPAQYGDADFDIRHVVAGAVTYDLPSSHASRFVNVLSGGWSLDESVHAQSALPVDVTATRFVDPATGLNIFPHPNVVPGVPFYLSGAACTASNGGVPCPGGSRINPAAFQAAPTGQSGNLGRNALRGLGAWQVDSAVRRQFNLSERVKLQFRAEAFNIFNHPNFGTPQTTLNTANFGEPTTMLGAQLGGLSPLYQIGGPRSLQFALKMLF